MSETLGWFLWNFATWITLGVLGGVATGDILDPDYLALLSSAWGNMSSNPYPPAQ